MRYRLGIALTSILLSVAPSSAQIRAEFDASADHDRIESGQSVVTSYELEHTPKGAPAPTITDLGKPTPTAGRISVTRPEIVLAPGSSHSFRVAAVGPGGRGWSDPTAITIPMPQPGVPGPVTITIVLTVAQDGSAGIKSVVVEP